MGNLISKISTFLMIFLALPSTAILVTWNTLPSEPLYPIKRGLENVALVILSPSFKARSSLQSELIGRRTTEATKVIIAQSNTQGLQELRTQVQSATLETANATKDPVAQYQAADKLIQRLEETNQALETSKVTIAQAPTPTTYIPPAAATPTPYIPPTVATPTSTPAPIIPINTPTITDQPIVQIDNTQEEIKEKIKELEKIKEEAQQRGEQERDEHSQGQDNGKGKNK